MLFGVFNLGLQAIKNDVTLARPVENIERERICKTQADVASGIAPPNAARARSHAGKEIVPAI